MKFSYKIMGMHCEACIEKIKSVLSPHFKVLEVTLNPPGISSINTNNEIKRNV